MKKLFLRFACLMTVILSAAPMAMGRQLTVEEAMKNAPAKFNQPGTRAKTEAVYTQKIADMNVAYVVNAPVGQGYVVLSADDVMPGVLGYSENGMIDADNIPPAMSEWLGGYARLLEYAVTNNLGVLGAGSTEFQTIAPLCKTQWNQGSPYNNLVPKIDDGHCATGCTATATAQVVKKHNWPPKGEGSHTYQTNGDVREELTFNFGETTFDWDNMVDKYDGVQTTEVQNNAVATLMAAVGNAACMNYGHSSGAWSYNALYGIVNYMGYDKSALHLQRNYFGHDEWLGMIYGELKAGRPVLYVGYNDGGGHAFVVDGYDSKGYFHLNWGWGGSSDGYFLLTGLDPANQGIGGSAAGYNSGQDASFNVMPMKEDSELTARLLGEGTLKAVKTVYERKETIQLQASGGNFYYTAIAKMNVTLGLLLTPVDGGDQQFIATANYNFVPHYGTPSMNTVGAFSVSGSKLPESGQFEVTPAFQYNDKIFPVHFRVGQSNKVLMTCDSEQITVKQTTLTSKMKVESLTMDGYMYQGATKEFNAVVSNEGDEYLGNLKLRAYKKDTGNFAAEMDGSGLWSDIPKDGSSDLRFKAKFISGGEDLKAGTYLIKIATDQGKVLSGADFEVIIRPTPPEGTPEFIGSWKVTGAGGGNGSSSNPYRVGDDFDIHLTVQVTYGLFDEKVNWWASYTSGSGWLDITSVSHNFMVGQGLSETKVYPVNVSRLEFNKPFTMGSYGWESHNLNWAVNSKTGGSIYITRDPKLGGVDDIEGDACGVSPNPASDYTTVTAKDAIKEVKVYSIAGALVVNAVGNGSSSLDLEVSSLASGHYVVVVETASGVERHKLIKR